jgi:hypothetical protein
VKVTSECVRCLDTFLMDTYSGETLRSLAASSHGWLPMLHVSDNLFDTVIRVNEVSDTILEQCDH